MSKSVYFSADGDLHAFLEVAEGVEPPPTLTVEFEGSRVLLGHCGSTLDVFTALDRHFRRDGRTQSQARLAELAGGAQQTVSRFVRGLGEPRISSEGWRRLGRAYRDAESHRSLVANTGR